MWVVAAGYISLSHGIVSVQGLDEHNVYLLGEGLQRLVGVDSLGKRTV